MNEITKDIIKQKIREYKERIKWLREEMVGRNMTLSDIESIYKEIKDLEIDIKYLEEDLKENQ